MRRWLVIGSLLALVGGCGGQVPASPSPETLTGPFASAGPGATRGAASTSRSTSTVTVPGAATGPGSATSPPTAPPPTFQPGQGGSPPNHPHLTVPPTSNGLDSLGPPAWVQAGTRVTFYQAAASVAQSRFAFVEDPAGEWLVVSTGKRYRRTDESGEGVPTASGDGLSQVDILAVEGTDVVGNITLYGIDRGNNQFVVVPGAGGKVSGKVVDGAWVHPDLLAQLATQDLGGLLVLRGPYRLGGRSYDAISFANPTPGAYQSYTYDAVTGLLLAATTSTAGATSPITAQNEPPPKGNTQLTITRLAGVRQRTVPGLGGRNPEWVARTGSLDYSGTYNFTNPVDPSSANLTYPMNVSVSFAPGGSNWSSYVARSLIQMPGGQPSQSAGVTGTTGTYWVDPAALTGLSAGQSLDEDPFTGERDVVRAVGPGPNGPAVTFAAQLRGVESQATYDQATGVLVQLILSQASNGSTIRLQLRQMP